MLDTIVVVLEGAAGVVWRVDEDALDLPRELLIERLARGGCRRGSAGCRICRRRSRDGPRGRTAPDPQGGSAVPAAAAGAGAYRRPSRAGVRDEPLHGQRLGDVPLGRCPAAAWQAPRRSAQAGSAGGLHNIGLASDTVRTLRERIMRAGLPYCRWREIFMSGA